MVFTNFADGFSFLDTPALIIVLLILLLLFGGKKLPELARSIGLSAKELRKGMNGSDDATESKPDQSAKAPENNDQSKQA